MRRLWSTAPSSADSLAPAGCVLVEAALEPGDDPHLAGRRLAESALAQLGGTLAYDGTRPIVVGAQASISISHTRTRVAAIAGPVARLGIDLVDDADQERIARIAPRLFANAGSAESAVAQFAATEAALKALGLGLLDGGMFDRACPVHVSLAPPRIVTTDGDELALVLGHLGCSTVAIVSSD